MQLIVDIAGFTSHYQAHLCLEHVDLLDSAGVGLPDDWDDVDLLVDLLHDLHIQGLQAMACRGDEVKTGVHSEIVKYVTRKRHFRRCPYLLSLMSTLSTLVSASR